MQVLYDDFETGSSKATENIVSPSCIAEVSAVSPIAGVYSAHFATIAQAWVNALSYYTIQSLNPIVLDFLFKVPQLPSGPHWIVWICSPVTGGAWTATDPNVYFAVLELRGNILTLYGKGVTTVSVAFPYENTVVRIRLEVSVSDSTGSVKLYINEVSQVEQTGLNNIIDSYNVAVAVRYGIANIGGAGAQSMDAYFDNISISGSTAQTPTNMIGSFWKTQLSQGGDNHFWGQIQSPPGTALPGVPIYLVMDGRILPPEEVRIPAGCVAGGIKYPAISGADGGIDVCFFNDVPGIREFQVHYPGDAEHAPITHPIPPTTIHVVPPYVPPTAPVVPNSPSPDLRQRTDRIGISLRPATMKNPRLWEDYLATKSAWTRMELNWLNIEKFGDGVYYFTNDIHGANWDEAVEQTFSARIGMIGLLDYGHPAYTGAWNKPPVTQDQINAWLRFVEAVVSRYKDKIAVWEVWNEPNAPGFWGGDKTGPGQGGNAAQYTNLLRQTYTLIKSIDPTAKVMLGGLWGNDCKFLQAIYIEGGKTYFDIAAIHPYPGMFLPNHVWGWYKLPGWDASAWGGYSPFDYPLLVKIWQIMDHYGDTAKPIWITEFGYSIRATDKPHPDSGFVGTAQEMYAEGIKMAYNFMNDENINWKWAENIDPPIGVTSIPNVEKLLIHIFDDGGNMGLYNADGTRREVAYSAFKTLATTYNTEVPPVMYMLTINSAPIEGVPIKINGVEYTTPISVQLPEGTHLIDAVTPAQIGEKTYKFVQWQDGTTNPKITINLTADSALTATYEEVPPKPPCFIASATYGSPLASELNVLRRFRDKCLPDKLVDAYYTVGPYLATLIKRRNMVIRYVRQVLNVFVKLLRRGQREEVQNSGRYTESRKHNC